MFRRLFAFVAIAILLSAQTIDVAKAIDFDENFFAGNSITFYDPRCATETGSGILTLAGNDNLEKILNFYMRKGLTIAQASGIAGNMMVESGLDPTIIQGGSHAEPGYTPQAGIGFGLVQWTSGGRQQNMVKHIEKLGVDITDLSGQLDFSWEEISNSYSSTLIALQATDDPVQAAVIVHDGYEKSADSKAKVVSVRGGNAKTVYDKFADAEALAGDTAPIEMTNPTGDTEGDNVALMSSEKPLASSTTKGSCVEGDFAGGDLSDTTRAYAWPQYISAGSSTSTMIGFEGRTIQATDMMDAYAKAITKAKSEKQYVGGSWFNTAGIDCGGFVTRLVIDSGFDKNYNYGGDIGKGAGYTVIQEKWLKDNWNSISATDASDRQPGDVAINENHTYIYVGRNVFQETDAQKIGQEDAGQTASASLNERAPMHGHEGVTDSSFRWYRKSMTIDKAGDR